MFNIGFSEFLLIAVIALLVIGPSQLPEVARVVGRLLNEFRRATQDLTGGLMSAGYEIKNSLEETTQEIVREKEKIEGKVADSIKEIEKNFENKKQKPKSKNPDS